MNEIKPLLIGKQYDRVADILRETLTPDCKELMHLPNETTLSRHEQYNLLLTALWESKNYEVRYLLIGYNEMPSILDFRM